MIGLLITLLILCLVFGIAVWAIQQLPLPPPFANIALAIVGLIAILVLLSLVLPLAGHPVWGWR